MTRRIGGRSLVATILSVVLTASCSCTTTSPDGADASTPPSRLCDTVQTLRPKMRTSGITFTRLAQDERRTLENEALTGAMVMVAGSSGHLGRYGPAVRYLAARFTAGNPERPLPEPTRTSRILASARSMDRDLLDGDSCPG